VTTRRTIRQVQCVRCGWTWYPKQPGRPKRCPHCTSDYWDQARIRAPRKQKEEKE
jgi:predicted Zn-ribbon and HTH transcriptional regulator